MDRRVVIAPKAGDEISDAFDWYEGRQTGLGDRFIKAVKRSIELAAVNPEFYPVRFDKVRRIMVKKFPYAVYYEQDEPIIYIHSVFHESRNPSHLDRLRNL